MNGDITDGNMSPSNQLQNEEDRIQELMGRSDTAVIFPEPVSDQEEGNNSLVQGQ